MFFWTMDNNNMSNKLIVCVYQHQMLFDKQDGNYKNNYLQDNIWQSIANPLGLLGSCCSVFTG